MDVTWLSDRSDTVCSDTVTFRKKREIAATLCTLHANRLRFYSCPSIYMYLHVPLLVPSKTSLFPRNLYLCPFSSILDVFGMVDIFGHKLFSRSSSFVVPPYLNHERGTTKETKDAKEVLALARISWPSLVPTLCVKPRLTFFNLAFCPMIPRFCAPFALTLLSSPLCCSASPSSVFLCGQNGLLSGLFLLRIQVLIFFASSLAKSNNECAE